MLSGPNHASLFNLVLIVFNARLVWFSHQHSIAQALRSSTIHICLPCFLYLAIDLVNLCLSEVEVFTAGMVAMMHIDVTSGWLWSSFGELSKYTYNLEY